jgi:hypothetical protein
MRGGRFGESGGVWLAYRGKYRKMPSNMRAKPSEMANCGNGNKKREWLRGASIQEIHEFIQNTSTDTFSNDYQIARTALEVKISESAENSSIRIEKSTKHLVVLTYILAAFTIGLFCLTIALVRHP